MNHTPLTRFHACWEVLVSIWTHTAYSSRNGRLWSTRHCQELPARNENSKPKWWIHMQMSALFLFKFWDRSLLYTAVKTEYYTLPVCGFSPYVLSGLFATPLIGPPGSPSHVIFQARTLEKVHFLLHVTFSSWLSRWLRWQSLPAMQETRVWSLGWEDSPADKNGYPLQYSFWRIPWTEAGYSPRVAESDMTEWLSTF